MGNEYITENDGKLHVRYSELVQCTPYGVQKVVEYRQGLRGNIETSHMILGSERHEQFAEESLKTSMPAKKFHKLLPIINFDSVFIEEELATEIFPEVILHSRPDFIGVKDGKYTIMDYKCSSQKPKHFNQTKQHLVYAYQLLCREVLCTEFYYLIEQWNKEKDTILRYAIAQPVLNRGLIIDTQKWLWERVTNLQTALDILQ